MKPMKIATEKGHEKVQRIILSQIEDGQLLPGQKSPSVEALSTAFGVSRSTIREALSALKATGWIDVRHGGGTFVSQVLPTDHQHKDPFKETENIREILEVRLWLESGAVSLAAERREEQDLQRLQQILERMQQALERDDTRLGEQADIDFHLAIAQASHLLNTLMNSLTSKLAETMGKTRQLWFFADKSSAARLFEEHQAIFEAIVQQDRAEAKRRIQAHLLKVEQVLKKMQKRTH